ncbi:HAMP domain-containing protein [Paenibacillus sp. NFR01]|nr:HAMP domain-containing protein [Paenibacillus sp. NFR01]
MPKMRLRTFFLQYLLFLSIGTILLLVLLLGLFTAAFSFNMVLPANYAEKEIAAAKDQLAGGVSLAPDFVPELAEYAVFTADGKRLSGNLSARDAARAWAIAMQGKSRDAHFYTALQSGEELWIFRYTLTPQYASAWLRNHLPNPQLLGILLFIFGILLLAAVLAARFGRRLTQKMAGLQEATENIRRENLEFTVQPSGIREIDEVLASLEQMKEALHASLKRQWELERSRREQISALAHDIKTPLTIIRGNAELLQETVQDEVQREYNGYILQSAGDIETFVQEVIDLSSLQSAAVQRKAPGRLRDFVAELENQLRALSTGKSIAAQVHTQEPLPESIAIDKELLQRGIVNVIANAVEHTPPHGSVTLEVRSDETDVCFTVTDTGPGFSAADLREAATQFYMGDRSRTSGRHHGMGLYIAESAAQQHGGTLTLENAPSGGGRVTLSVAGSQIR